MLNQAAYSCTHYFLWTHLHIIKPQSLLRLGAQLKGCVKLIIPASRRVLFHCFSVFLFLLTTAVKLNIFSGVIMIK